MAAVVAAVDVVALFVEGFVAVAAGLAVVAAVDVEIVALVVAAVVAPAAAAVVVVAAVSASVVAVVVVSIDVATEKRQCDSPASAACVVPVLEQVVSKTAMDDLGLHWRRLMIQQEE